jgi:hypothetical protein
MDVAPVPAFETRLSDAEEDVLEGGMRHVITRVRITSTHLPVRTCSGALNRQVYDAHSKRLFYEALLS